MIPTNIEHAEHVPQDGTGLLARLKPYQLPPAELRAYIEAEVASARCGPAPVQFEPGDDDEEWVEPAATAAPAPRRQRKRSLAKVCEAARKAGADRVIVDGVVIVLSPAAAVAESNGNEFDKWMARRHENPVKGH